MSQITRVPFGLQDLLGSKNFGVNPTELGQQVNPTLEMFPFLAAERLTYFDSGAMTVFSDSQWFIKVIPDGELWMVDGVGINVDPVTTAVGQTLTSGVRIKNPPNLNLVNGREPLADLGTFENNTIGGLSHVQTHDFPRLVPLFGSSELQFQSVGDFSGASSYNLTASIRYIKLFI